MKSNLYATYNCTTLASKSALKGFLFENDREKDEINTSQALNHAEEILKGTNVIHFNIVSEVFLSAGKGFNVS